jgi:hypothetical protein
MCPLIHIPDRLLQDKPEIMSSRPFPDCNGKSFVAEIFRVKWRKRFPFLDNSLK